MPDVQIEPTKDHPIPYDLSPEKADTLLDEVVVAANTIELQTALGAALELDPADAAREKELLNQVISKGRTAPLKEPNTAFAAAAFLRTYGSQLALDAAKARAAITNKLMEIANCGDPKYELKALELLGKHSDIGLFTERSEVTINYKDPKALEDEIKERVRRLLNASVVDTVPRGAALDEELGVFTPEPSLLEELEGATQPTETGEDDEQLPSAE
jgi:hypothetical protein